VADVLFERDRSRYVATELARGPWDPGSCHGGAPSALLAALVDSAPSLAPMRGVRLTYDLLRPVPVGPVDASVEVVREGKRVQLVDAHLTSPDGTELVRCRALRIRDGDVELPAGADDDAAARWDRTSVHGFSGTYGDYVLGKVAKVFPDLADDAVKD
jgi:hypothetical protein